MPLILISGPLDTAMITLGMAVLRLSAGLPAAAPTGLVPCASVSTPNLLKVEESMKNMRSRNTTSTSGTSGSGLRMGAGASTRKGASLGRERCHLIELAQLILGDALGEKAGEGG